MAAAAALTAAGQPMQLVDVFDLLFGRNAADLAALLPGGMLGGAAPMVRGLLVLWSVLPVQGSCHILQMHRQRLS